MAAVVSAAEGPDNISLGMAKIIVLMGAPGAGKGTQARLLHERLNLPQISTGDMFRALKEAHTPLAAEVRALMEAGQLVPDDLTIRVVQERTARDDCRGGYILAVEGVSGRPRQANRVHTVRLAIAGITGTGSLGRLQGGRACRARAGRSIVHFAR